MKPIGLEWRLRGGQESSPRRVKRVIELLASHGIRRRSILVYMLYNFQDTPDNLFERMRDILHWGLSLIP